MEVHVTWKGHHLANSPYVFKGRVYAESCDCPLDSIDEMIDVYQCSANVSQIDQDLSQFQNVDFNNVLTEAKKRFSHAGSYSFCHYVVLKNKVYRILHFTNMHAKYINFVCCVILKGSSSMLWPTCRI
jgi:hypothetical protein